MATLSELLKELQTLPVGNIYQKTINGKIYNYHQYFENGKRYTKIISEDEAAILLPLIKRRQELQILIKNIKSKEKSITLSKNANKLTGYVMNKNKPVAEFENGVLITINEKLAPLVIKKTHSLEKFLSLRVIDMSRTNARLLKKALNINTDEEYKIPLFAYALSVSDTYWFKPKHSKLKYQDIKINNDIYSNAALEGDMTIFPHQTKLTPEITTTGSFEKGWKIIDNHWWLYKTGNNKQIFSELFCYQFAKLIGIETATYEYDGKYIRSLNFAEKYNFEPIASLAGDDDNYEHIFNILLEINRNITKDYLKLIFFDSVIYNIDRHNENLGLLRDIDNGRIISLAPNFDNNLALISSVDKLNDPKKDSFIKLFVTFAEHNKTAKELFKEIAFKDITIEDIKKIIDDIQINIPYKDDISQKVYQRYNYLKYLF